MPMLALSPSADDMEILNGRRAELQVDFDHILLTGQALDPRATLRHEQLDAADVAVGCPDPDRNAGPLVDRLAQIRVVGQTRSNQMLAVEDMIRPAARLVQTPGILGAAVVAGEIL